LNWVPFHNGNAVLHPTLGQQGIDDPFILRKPDGHFIIIASDKRRAGRSGASKFLHVWESRNLIDFAQYRLVQVHSSYPMYALSPEAFYDPARGQYAIIWSGHTDRSRIYVNYTTDFVNVSAPEVFFDPGVGVMDATIYMSKMVNYLYYKKESDQKLYGAWSTSLSPGSFNVNTYTTGIGDFTESPLIVKELIGEHWFLWAGTGKAVNRQLHVWESLDITQNTWSSLNRRSYNPPINAKHPTVIAITQAELNDLLATWHNPTWNRLRSYNFPERYVRHNNFIAEIVSYPFDPFMDSQFRVVPGLADAAGISFESVSFPGYYLRHDTHFRIVLNQNNGSASFKADATFYKISGLKEPSWSSFRSYNIPTRYIRHDGLNLYLHPIETDIEKQDATFLIEH
jgi:hypothetical protein